VPRDVMPTEGPEQLAARARREARLLVTAGRLEAARDRLLRSEVLLADYAAQAHGEGRRRAVPRALRDVRRHRFLLDQATGRAPAKPPRPKPGRPEWETLLSEAATLISWGQMARARAALDTAAEQLAHQEAGPPGVAGLPPHPVAPEPALRAAGAAAPATRADPCRYAVQQRADRVGWAAHPGSSALTGGSPVASASRSRPGRPAVEHPTSAATRPRSSPPAPQRPPTGRPRPGGS
jgi:hypothetical protein